MAKPKDIALIEKDPTEERSLKKSFGDALRKVQSAQAATKTEFWDDQFRAKKDALNTASLKVKDFIKDCELKDATTIKNAKKYLGEASVCADEFNALVDHVIALVRTLCEFHDNYPLYKDNFTHTASFDMENGELRIRKLAASKDANA